MARTAITLKETWSGGAQTLVGMLVEGFPNLLMLLGPHTALGNIPRSIEYNVDWVSRLLDFMRQHGLTHVAPRPEAVAGLDGACHGVSARACCRTRWIPGSPA